MEARVKGQAQGAGVDPVVGQGVEHECVVGVGAVADPDDRLVASAHVGLSRAVLRTPRRPCKGGRPGRENTPGSSPREGGRSREG